MAVPRKRLTKRRIGNRRSHQHGKTALAKLAKCTNCGAAVRPHVICNECGYYKGKKVLAKLR
jgi:large subunit ribosomal protein L32